MVPNLHYPPPYFKPYLQCYLLFLHIFSLISPNISSFIIFHIPCLLLTLLGTGKILINRWLISQLFCFDPYECPMFDCQVKFVPVSYSIASQNVNFWDGEFCLLRKQFSILYMPERHWVFHWKSQRHGTFF